MLQNILTTLIPQLLNILIPLLIIPLVIRFMPKLLPVTGDAFNWVKGKAGQIQNAFAAGVLQRATDVVEAVVLNFENTRIESLKEIMSDGQITKEELLAELQKVKDDAMKQVKDLISGQGLWDGIMYVFGNTESEFQKWVDSTIETAVSKLPPSGLQTSKDGVSPPALARAKPKQA